jgi:hypothetical protein
MSEPGGLGVFAAVGSDGVVGVGSDGVVGEGSGVGDWVS